MITWTITEDQVNRLFNDLRAQPILPHMIEYAHAQEQQRRREQTVISKLRREVADTYPPRERVGDGN